MSGSIIEKFLGGSYTQRNSLVCGFLMLIVGGALLFWRTAIEPFSWALATGSLCMLGGLLLMMGPVASWLEFGLISEHWCITTGIGSIIIGISMVLIPIFQPTITLIAVGLLAGISLISQGIMTIQDQLQIE